MTKISQLSSIGDSLAIGDQFLIRDIDDATTPNKSVTISGITRALDTGTALAPALAFASDKNTGLYSPGADQVAITTGGTQRLSINANGLLSTTAVTPAVASFTGPANAYIDFTDGTGIFRTQLSSNTPFIGSASNHGLILTTNNTERLRITSDGKVGIGTSSPYQKLDVANGDLCISKTTGGDVAGVISQGLLLRTQSGDLANIYAVSSGSGGPNGFGGSLRIQSKIDNGALADRITVLYDGKVGIGTSSPGGALDVSVGGAGPARIILSHESSNPYLDFYRSTGFESNLYGFRQRLVLNDFVFENAPSNTLGSHTFTERLRITSDGKVGIGTSSPSNTAGFGQQLELAGSIPCLTINQTNAGFTLAKYSIGADSVGGLGVWHNNTSLYRMYINNAGNVGIGTTSPGDRLELQGGAFRIAANSNSYHTIAYSSDNFLFTANAGAANQSSNFVFSSSTAGGAVTERARIDSSGRLLVGTSAARTGFYGIGWGATVQFETTGISGAVSNTYNENSATAGSFVLAKSRGGSAGSYTAVQAGDSVGSLSFQAADGTDFAEAAGIYAQVDGTPGANDMPGRLVFATTADGTASLTEAMRITNDRVVAYNQVAPATVNTTATITAANLKTGIITSTTAAAVTMTLPTGTDIEAGFSGVYTNFTFEFSVINTGPNALTVGANGNTTVGSLTVATGTSARYALRRTGANTWTLYRLS